MILGNIEERTTGYGNFLPLVLSVFHHIEWWVDTGANVHVCVLTSPCLPLIRPKVHL
jgi:hypothetical protein